LPASAPSLPWELPRFRNWIAVAKTHQLVEKAMSAGLATLDLKLPQYDILANIFRFEGLTQQELADRLLVGRSNMSMLLPELEKRQLILRTPDKEDRRIRRLSLTQQGRVLAQKALQVQVSVIEDMMTVLTAEECEQLGDYMRKIGTHLIKGGKKNP
jgi:MarR family transcriptional regulator, organic hydroperoxide resistance regulator